MTINTLLKYFFFISSIIGPSTFMLPSLLYNSGIYTIAGVIIVFIATNIILSVYAKTFTLELLTNILKSVYGKSITSIFLIIYWIFSWLTTIIIINEFTRFFAILVLGTNTVLSKIILIIILLFINILGLKNSYLVEFVLTLIKILSCLLIPFIIIYTGKIQAVSYSLPSLSNILQGTLTLFWVYLGFESGILMLDEKVKQREIQIPILVASIIYIINILAIYMIYPNPQELTNLTVLCSLFQKLIPYGDKIIAIIVCIISLGSINAWNVISSYFAENLANQKMLPGIFKIKNKYGAPYLSLLIVAFGMSLAIIWGGNFVITLISISNLFLLSFYTFISFALLCYLPSIYTICAFFLSAFILFYNLYII